MENQRPLALTKGQIGEIRKRKSTETISNLAKEFNVSSKTIRRLLSDEENITKGDSEAVRKHQINLDLQTKHEIIQKLDAGYSQSELVAEYSISETTMWRIRKDKEKIIKKIEFLKYAHGDLKIKTLNGAEDSDFDKALYAWYLQCRSIGEPVTGSLLKAEAAKLNMQLDINDPGSFNSISGFLNTFKKKHNINELSVEGEHFKNDFSKYLLENNYVLDNIYNADETGLIWRSLPRKTLITKAERSTAGLTDIEDKVTVMFCANVTGTHKLPLLVIGKSKHPTCFNGKPINILPFKYAGQRSAWMDQKLFKDWFTNLFIPEVIKNQVDSSLCPTKVLLLLDNAPSHPSLSELNAVNELVQVMYLPPNVTAMIQPMQQGVIEKVKMLYRKYILKDLILDKTEGSIEDKITKLTLKDCCYNIDNAWNLVKPVSITNAWNEILSKEQTVVELENYLIQIWSTLLQIPEYYEYKFEDVLSWVKEDFGETGWEVLSSSQILGRIQKSFSEAKEEDSDSDFEDIEQCSTSENEPKISREDAYDGLKTFRNWFINRQECTPEDTRILQKYLNAVLDIDNR